MEGWAVEDQHAWTESWAPNKPKPIKKPGCTSDTETIKNDIFHCRKPEHAAAFGHPREATYKREVCWSSNSSLLWESILTEQDVTNAQKILGPSLQCTRGIWTRGRSNVVRPDYIYIPADLKSMNKYVTVAADVMFVLGLPFLVTLLRRVRYVTIQFALRRPAAELASTLKLVVALYWIAGSDCTYGHWIWKSEEKIINIIEANIKSWNYHVLEIEGRSSTSRNEPDASRQTCLTE